MMETLYVKCATLQDMVARLPEWMVMDGTPLPVSHRHVFDWNIGDESSVFLANLRMTEPEDVASVREALGEMVIAAPEYPRHIFMGDDL